MQLRHPIKDFLSDDDLKRLFANLSKFNTFCNRLETIALDKYPTSLDDRNLFKGDLFELFVEFLIRYCGTDRAIAIKDYKVVQELDRPDYGVDGAGISTVNSFPATVQVKYRQSNHTLTQNEGRLGNFFEQSYWDFFSPASFTPERGNNANMLVITSGEGLHYSVDEISYITMRCINRQGLRELTDNVQEFWKDFQEAIRESQIKEEAVDAIVLRDHQNAAVTAIINDMVLDDGKGQIILPTGSGKTYIQAEAIVSSHNRFGHKTFLILSPRILLSFQLLREISTYLISKGVKAEYLNVNSGRFDEQLINDERRKAGVDSRRIHSTTSSEAIRAIAEDCATNNKILIISSTYHSAERIRESGVNIDVQLNDEAHNMVSEEFNNCHGIGSNEFSFTATKQITSSDVGLGMNNEDLWGNVVYERTPKEMIDIGEILPVVAHIVSLPLNETHIAENDYNAIFRCVTASLTEHGKALCEVSADPSLIAPKMLVALDGQRTLEGILGCEAFGEYESEHPDVKIFAISSDLGAYMDGVQYHANSQNKDKLLSKLQALNDTTSAIIMHISMLGEGIDVPGITAFMPMRGIGPSMFKQSIGRAMRLFRPDKLRFYSGDLLPAFNNDGKYIKPCAYVVMPNVVIGADDSAEMHRRQWMSIYDDFGRPERVIISHYNGRNTESALEPVNELDHRLAFANSGVDEFVHQIINRPDQRGVADIWFMELLDKVGGEFAKHVFNKLELSGKISDLQTLLAWHQSNERTTKDIIDMSRSAGQGSFHDDVKAKFGTIYTPDFVVEKTIDLALKYVPDGTDLLKLTYCDPAVGDGNFLACLYHRLMGCDSISDPIERSYYILTKCLWGVEILSPMVKATKLRLLLLHLGTVQKHDGDTDRCRNLIDELNVHHGNTILSPEDDFELILKHEGGLLPEWLRNKKYDVIVGNPPYTHLRNLDNRRYHSYPKQRDMAQVFVRWALDHLAKNGVCGLNISEAWLRYKSIDGAAETRRLMTNKMREILQDQAIETYSKGDGGNIGTAIIVFGPSGSLIINDICQNVKYSGDFVSYITPKPYKSSYLVGTLHEHRYCKNKFSIDSLPKWDEILVQENNGTQHYIMCKESFGRRVRNNFKLVRTTDPKDFLDNNCAGQPKYIEVDRRLGVWLVAFLNSKLGLDATAEACQPYAEQYKISTRAWQSIPIPDYDYYSEHRPEQTSALLSWVEENMHDKDKFLAGVDEMVEALWADE